MNETSFRLRIEYGKTGRLRYLSHLEVIRALERTVRRAQLPFILSKGFNVHMRHAFGPALPVGTAGLQERFDVWLSEYIPAKEALARLRAVAVADIPIMAAEYCALSDPSVEASITQARYDAHVDFHDMQAAQDFIVKLHELCAKGEITITKKGKHRRIDLAEQLCEMPVALLCEKESVEQVAEKSSVGSTEASDVRVAIRFELLATANGFLRPESLLHAVCANVHIHELTRTTICYLSH